MSGYTIGIDVGGSKTAYGLFGEDGALLQTRRHASDPALSAEAFFHVIAGTIRELCTQHGISMDELRGIGMGMPSFIRFDEGRIVKTSNLTNIKDFPAKAYMKEMLGGAIDFMIDNDSHTGALAEHRYGAGRGFAHMLYCPVSTGISSGIIIDGKLFHGQYGWSGESGHMIVTPGQGIDCGCGNRGCLMSWCSGSMIVKHVQSWIAQGEKTVMTTYTDRLSALSPMHIDKAFAQGDPMAARAVEQMAQYMGVWIYNLYVTLNINCFVFGGGLLHMGAGLLERVRVKFDQYNQNDLPVYFKTAALGDDLGVIGARELLF